MFYGNEAAQRLLARTLESGRVGHAYLFFGNDGLGKKTFAQLFAKSVMCKGPSRPCGVCSACRKIDGGVHPDVQVYLGGQARGSVHIETIRQIRADCAVKPNEGQKKIYLLTNIQNMTTGAYNAFLKTLEEPPDHVLFLLTAPNISMLPSTIVSRVIPVELYPLPEETVAAALRDRFPDRDPAELTEAARLSQGNLGQALELLAGEGAAARREQVRELCALTAAKREYPMLVLLGGYERDKPGLTALLRDYLSLLRESLLQKAGVPGASAEASQLAAALTKDQLTGLILFLEEGIQKLNTNAHGGMLTAYLCAGINRLIR